jgi:hypothetical protein
MARTRSELVIAVLREMGVLDASEEPGAEDSTHVKGVYDDKLEHWIDEEIAYWSADEIPNAVFIAVRDIMINEVSGSFGQPVPLETKQAREIALTTRLRRHAARHRTGLPIPAEYF